MKPTLTKLMLALFAVTALAAVVLAEQQSRSVLGKIDHSSLMEAVPGVPATPAAAATRAYGPNILEQNEAVGIEATYAPFNKRAVAARDVIKDAVANRARNQEAIGQRSIAQANASPIISRMGGVENIGQMSEEQVQQAAIQATGSYQQSLSGAPEGVPSGGGGMQAMMQRMMNDPAYQERFEKMSKKEQEAELQKYMGNAHAPAPPTGPTAAERQAQLAVNETTAVVAQQKELGAIMQRMLAINAEFTQKDQAIMATPGTHEQMLKEIGARMEKIPEVTMGEMTDRDPVKVQALQREHVTRDRTRAAWELQQRSTLYTQRKAKAKEVAAAYAAWLRQNMGGVTTQTAQLLDDSTIEMAVGCEEDLINVSEDLARYTTQVTRDAAQYEWAYQKKMSEPTVKPIAK